MTPLDQDARRGKKQFRLVKFFSYASFIVLVIFSFPFSVVISNQAKDMLIKSYENYALLLGGNLNHQVFQNFVVPVTSRYGKVRLREERQYQWMDQIVKNTIHSFNIDLVNVYDIGKGVIAYSTDSRLLGKKAKETSGYKSAVKGEHSSGLISERDDLWGLGIERIGGQKKIRTYIPFMGLDSFTGDKGYVLGVFELIQDLSQEYKSIVKLQYLIFGLSILIMGLIFVALLLIVHKAEKTIEERAREQRELESQLNQAERLAALGQMCAGVSHEIRNPLGIIRSTAELLAGMPDSNESQRKLSSMIIEESSRLNNIVTEFLDFARPLEPNLQDCYLEDIIKRNLAFLHPELEKQKISIYDNLNNRSMKIKADPQMLYRVFLNIFVNCIQSMKDGGAVTVNVAEEKGHYIVEIRDTGSGISEEDLGKIFDPFFSKKDKGSGLGLSIVRNIIEGHRGSIKIESKVGSGTSVIISLPRA
ncbi:MAG TPA: ATP-binding protein [Acidobacteriota bacterium]|nr:ATP-binding protein [Acidobacteriota bacterium]